MRNCTLHTRQIKPPIPTKKYDWEATLGDYDIGHPVGLGPTEADAVYDLFCQIAEREEGEGPNELP